MFTRFQQIREIKVMVQTAVAIALVTVFSGCVDPDYREASKPNVIVILVDDMRTGITGHEGNPIIETPHLDRLASEGTVFSNAFATSPVCTPSRTNLLTGLYERRHGVNFGSNSSMTEEAWYNTYPMLLKEAGYFVGYIGKNHTPIGKNDDKGFGYQSGVMESSFDYWYASHNHLTFYPKDKKRHMIFKNAKADTQIEILAEGLDNFMSPNDAFSAGYNFLESRPKNQPFAVLINFNVPHDNATGSMQMRATDPELYKTYYRDKIDEITLPRTYVAAKDITNPKLPRSVYSGVYHRTYNYVKEPETLVEQKIREMQTVTGVDRLLGKLFLHLEDQGVADNTIIVFTSDHGVMQGEFGMGGKALLYEPSVRVPMIVYDPRIKVADRVRKNTDLVALIDIAPTVLDLTNTSSVPEMHGRSMRQLLKKANEGEAMEPWRQEVFLENMMMIQNYPRVESVRTHKFKYLRYFDKKNDGPYEVAIDNSIKGEKPIYEELYDLEADPDEVTNLIGLAEYQNVADQLRRKNAELVKFYRGTGSLNTHIKEQ